MVSPGISAMGFFSLLTPVFRVALLRLHHICVVVLFFFSPLSSHARVLLFPLLFNASHH